MDERTIVEVVAYDKLHGIWIYCLSSKLDEQGLAEFSLEDLSDFQNKESYRLFFRVVEWEEPK